MAKGDICRIENCGKVITRPRGTLCSMHFSRWSKYKSYDLLNDPDPLVRIFEKIIINGKTNCWEWQGQIYNSGYGYIKYKQKLQLVHRLCYSNFYNDIPEGMNVLHQCDNRRCSNPYHLFLGTRKDNMQDMIKKGRRAFGNAKLNEEKAKEIIQKHSNGLSRKAISLEYNVHECTIRRILSGKTWIPST